MIDAGDVRINWKIKDIIRVQEQDGLFISCCCWNNGLNVANGEIKHQITVD